MKTNGRPPTWSFDEVQEARMLRDTDPKRWTYKALAEWYGCSLPTMAGWLQYKARTGGKLYGERA